MVYCGKPSKSCRQCRKRDIKCDKRKYSCGQCLRANLPCPGYVNPSTLIFKDETKSVVRKAQVESPRSPAPYIHSKPVSPGRPLLPTLEDRAKDLFISHYVFGPSPQYPYMKSFYYARPQHTPLAISVRAVSLAYLSSVLSSSEILLRARQRYASALRLVSEALRCPIKAKDNAILLTVLLLDLFEKLTRRLTQFGVVGDAGYESGRKHIDGAMALVQLGGKDQFGDEIRLRLFHQLSLKILLRSLESGAEVPADLLALRRLVDVRGREWDVEELLIRVIELRNGVWKGDIRDVEMIEKAEELDEVLDRVSTSKSLRWRFRDVVMGHVSNGGVLASLIEVGLIP